MQLAAILQALIVLRHRVSPTLPKYEKLYRYHIPYGENCQAKSGGFKFNLKAGNGEIIATSQVYKSPEESARYG